jgi:hypothetical protein
MSFRYLALLLSFAFAAVSAEEMPKVVWASEMKEWEGWKPDIVRLREARKEKPLAGYLYSEEVKWGSYHDEAICTLEDGRDMTADLNDFTWETLHGWKPGKKLFLCYDEARGATLLDPASGRCLFVRMITGKTGHMVHPIDAYVRSLEATTTYDMMSSCYEGSRLMRLEIDRCVKEVLALKHLPDVVRRDFILLTKVRLDYCEMQARFGVKAIHASYGSGTAAGPIGLEYRLERYRQALADLLVVYQEYMAFAEPQEGK